MDRNHADIVEAERVDRVIVNVLRNQIERLGDVIRRSPVPHSVELDLFRDDFARLRAEVEALHARDTAGDLDHEAHVAWRVRATDLTRRIAIYAESYG